MADQTPQENENAEQNDRSGWWMGFWMCVGIAVLMLIGWLGRGSVSL